MAVSEGGGSQGSGHERVVFLGIGKPVYPEAVVLLPLNEFFGQNFSPPKGSLLGSHFLDSHSRKSVRERPAVVEIGRIAQDLPLGRKSSRVATDAEMIR